MTTKAPRTYKEALKMVARELEESNISMFDEEKFNEQFGKRIRYFRTDVYRGKLSVTRKDFVDDLNSVGRSLGIDIDMTTNRYRKYEEGVNPPHKVKYILARMGFNMKDLYRDIRE